jgi:hypothetical protein
MVSSPAQADVIHIEHKITDPVSIDADFSLHEVETASVIRLERVNLIDEAFTEKMAEILFHLDGDVSHTKRIRYRDTSSVTSGDSFPSEGKPLAMNECLQRPQLSVMSPPHQKTVRTELVRADCFFHSVCYFP